MARIKNFSTFAWYTAANATINKIDASSGTISTSSSTLDVNEFYLVLEIGTPTELKLTDSSGESFVKVGDYLKKVTVEATSLENAVTVTPKFYKTDNGDGTYSDLASADELKGVGGGTYNFVITATGRTRIANNVTTFHATNVQTAGYGYGLKISGSVNLAAAGTYTISTLAYSGSGNQTAVGAAQSAGTNITVKYSIGGEDTDANRSDNDSYTSDADAASSVTGGFSIAFAA